MPGPAHGHPVLSLDPLSHWILTLSLALLWLAAAWHKFRDPDRFTAAVTGYRLLPAHGARFAAGLIRWLEAALAAAILLPAGRRWAAPVGAVLLVLYGGAIAFNLVRGRADIDCGCHAGTGAPLAWRLVWRNLFLAVLSLLLVLPVLPREMTIGDWLAAAAGTALACTAYVLAGAILGERAYNAGAED